MDFNDDNDMMDHIRAYCALPFGMAIGQAVATGLAERGDHDPAARSAATSLTISIQAFMDNVVSGEPIDELIKKWMQLGSGDDQAEYERLVHDLSVAYIEKVGEGAVGGVPLFAAIAMTVAGKPEGLMQLVEALYKMRGDDVIKMGQSHNAMTGLIGRTGWAISDN